jgi:hypothetical protein
MSEITTKIGRCEVIVRRANFPSLRHFSGGAHGRKEAGIYSFWTVVLRRKGKNRVWGRALSTLPAGDRFDRMRREMLRDRSKENRAHYERIWKKFLKEGRAIRYIRPSTEAEIAKWMRGHKADAKYAKKLVVR